MNDIRRFISKEPLPIPKDTAVKRPSLDEMHSNVKQVRAAASHPLTDAIDKALRNDNRISTWEWTSRLDGIEQSHQCRAAALQEIVVGLLDGVDASLDLRFGEVVAGLTGAVDIQ